LALSEGRTLTYPHDVNNEEYAFVAPYLPLVEDDGAVARLARGCQQDRAISLSEGSHAR